MRLEEIKIKFINKTISLRGLPGLTDVINKKKNDRVECKIQLNKGVNFISTNDTEEIRA